MRILVFGINYAPELTGIGKYTAEMCEWLSHQGQDVSVITANPYYPEWKIHSGYRNLFKMEILNGVKVYRCPLYIPQKISGLRRILHELSFVLSASVYWLGFLTRKRFDVLICIAPPFHTGLFGIVYRLIRKTKLVYHIQDLQIDVARDLDIIKNERFISLIFSLEKFILKRVEMVTSISEGMIKKINGKLENREAELLPNWVDIEFIKPMERRDSLRSKFGIAEDDFVILYSGNLGEKQGLNSIIEAAKSFRVDTSIKFLICGSGAYESVLKKAASEYCLENVIFVGLQPYRALPNLLNSADVHLVLQKRMAADLVLPSKLTSIAASGGASIVTAEPETSLYKLVNSNKIGFVIEPENVQALIEAIQECLRRDLTMFRNNARKYAESHLNKEVILRTFLTRLQRLNE